MPFPPRFAEQARVAIKEANPPAYHLFQYPIQKAMEKALNVPPSSFDDPYGGNKTEFAMNLLKAAMRGPLSAIGYKEVVSPAMNLARERHATTSLPRNRTSGTGNAVTSLRLYKKNPAAARIMTNQAIRQGILTEDDRKSLDKRTLDPQPLLNIVKPMSAEDAIDVYERGDHGEKHLLYDEVERKIKASKSMPPRKQDFLLKKLEALKRGH